LLKATLKSLHLSNIRHNLILFKTSGLLIIIAVIFSSYEVLAQASKSIMINRNIVNQPLIAVGIGGGKITAQEISQTENTATGYCDGYVQLQPNHLLKLESFFEFLRLEVNSRVDTTILIKGPGGIWCNDDSGTANPMIEGQWQPGIYQIWIGSYQNNTSNDYQIKVTGR
jgi:hypothetical protein